MSTQKEIPILMSAPMVLAILAGRKTQTRRVVKPQPDSDWSPVAVERYTPVVIARNGEEREGRELFGAYDDDWGVACPYGGPSDVLWLKETFCYGDRPPCDCLPSACPHKPEVHYRADWGGIDDDVLWRPSIFMPRWASRITLRITDVRVQRVQDISEADAADEGCCGPQATVIAGEIQEVAPNSYRDDYRELWDSINGKKFPWASNPFVWVLTFQTV
jgi:hypothetical protein